MPLFDTPDGHYTHAITTAGQGDGNDVVYDNWVVPGKKTPVWDKFSYEAAHGTPSPRPPIVPPWVPVPVPSATTPVPPLASRVIRVTTEQDGPFAPRMYAYWPNAWVSSGIAHVFAGSVQTGGPQFFEVNLASGAVSRHGMRQVPYRGETEGWYWNTIGWVYLIDGPRLRCVNPFTGEDQIVFDISDAHPGCDLWQAHSSDDGQTHSATVRRIVPDGKYPYIGTIVVRPGRRDFFPATGTLDESQVDPTGEFVVIKETLQRDKARLDNRIVATGVDDWIRDEDGAFGHSDLGPGFIVGEDDQIGACVWMDLRTRERRTLFSTWGMGHVSVCGGRCLGSDDTHLYDVRLDGSGRTPLIAHGNNGTTGANLSPCGRVATYMVGRSVYLLGV